MTDRILLARKKYNSGPDDFVHKHCDLWRNFIQNVQMSGEYKRDQEVADE